jgi:DNA-binding SARP family transcriptional activator
MLPFVQLLGVAKVNLESQEVIFLSDKRFLLLAYLAFKADWVSREALSILFFEDSDSASARKNLRHLLSRVRALDFVVLESSGEQVRWLVRSDTTEFQLLISSKWFIFGCA